MNNNIMPDPEAVRCAEAQGIVFSEDKKTVLNCTDRNITRIVIPDGVSVIGSEAFCCCEI